MELLGERIAESAAHIDAAMHRLLTDIRAFDVGGGWHQQGAVSCAHWLSWRVGWDLGTARERVRVARRLAELPKIDEALRCAEVSFSKVRAMTRVATVDNEALLLSYAAHAPAAQLEAICRKYQMVQRLAKADPEAEAARRQVTRRHLDDGMVRIDAVLRPEEAALVWAAIERAAAEVSAETRSRADGLVALAQHRARGERPDRTPCEVVVTVSQDTLAGRTDDPGSLGDDTCVSAETSRRIACDAGVVQVIESATGEVLSVGRKTRSIPTPIKRALAHRDRTCRFPGCTHRTYVDGHHIQHWAEGGETALTNLVLLCDHHHRFVHEHGYRVALDDQQRPSFFDPRGRRLEPLPPRPRARRPGWEAIEAANRELAITATTGLCRWDGRPVDYSAAVDGLLSFDV